MPTVLTERLKERKFNLVDWMLVDVIRLFGLTACLRDEYKDFNKKQILKALKKYDKYKYEEREKELHPKYPPILSERKLRKKYNKLIKITNKELQENIQAKANVEKCIEELDNIEKRFNKADYTELVVGLLETTREQLDIAQEGYEGKIECDKELLRKNSTFEKYKRNQEKERKKEIEYLDQDRKEAQNQVMFDYAGSYQRLIDLFSKQKKEK